MLTFFINAWREPTTTISTKTTWSHGYRVKRLAMLETLWLWGLVWIQAINYVDCIGTGSVDIYEYTSQKLELTTKQQVLSLRGCRTFFLLRAPDNRAEQALLPKLIYKNPPHLQNTTLSPEKLQSKSRCRDHRLLLYLYFQCLTEQHYIYKRNKIHAF